MLHTIFALAFSPDEKVLKTIGDWGDKEFYIEYWDVQTGESIKDVLLNDENYTVASLSPDGKTLACAGDSPLQFWNIETTQQFLLIQREEGYFDYVEFSPDGRDSRLQTPGTISVYGRLVRCNL